MDFRWTLYRSIIIGGLILLMFTVADAIRLAARPAPGPSAQHVPSGKDPTSAPSEITGDIAAAFRLPAAAEMGDASAGDGGRRWVSRHYGVELKGTVAGRMAVVTDRESHREQVLTLGQKTRAFTVESIGRNQLVINGDEGRETLVLPSNRDGDDPEHRPATRILSRDDLSRLLGSVDRLAAEITLQPVRAATGGMAGYRVVSLKPRGTLAAMGLRKNDILRTINGQSIRTPEDVYRVLESAVHEKNLTVTIRRNSSDRQFHYQIR